MKTSIYAKRASRISTANLGCLVLLSSPLMAIGTARACGSNGDFILAPSSSGTPTLVHVFSHTLKGANTGSGGIGSVAFGSTDGKITQTQTMRIAATGHLFPDNSDTCSSSENSASVLIEKTAILDMQGGSVEPTSLLVDGPVAGDAALGGIFQGFGTFKALSSTVPKAIDIESATLHPLGVLSLEASTEQSGSTFDDTIAINNSTFRVMIGGDSASYLEIVRGDVSLSNTKLVVDFPSGFTATPGQQFTLVKFDGGTRSGTFSNSSGSALAEGATVTVNGNTLKISYVGGASGSDIVLKSPIATPLPTLSVSNANSNFEGTAAAPGTTTFDIALSAASDSTVTVNYATADGTAVAGKDYVEKHGKITFLPGETLKSVTIKFVGDSVAELVETLFFNLNTPANATIADGQGTTSIRNDDGPNVTIENPPNVKEGNSGTVAQKFIVRLSQSSTNTITMNWATSNGTATTADYTAATGTVTFAPGQTSKGITILVKGDTIVEPNETYKVTLSALKYAVFTDSQAVGIIVNDD